MTILAPADPTHSPPRGDPPPPEDRDSSSGAGRLRFSLAGGRTVVSQARAASPLKILCLSRPAGWSWALTSTYGGGLVGGDRIAIDVDLDPGTRCFLGTQASTKIYRALAGRMSCQNMRAALGARSLCVSFPDPITCFAGARFRQRQCFDLADTASLALVDWLTSGRHAAGERWAFQSYDSRLDVRQSGKLLVRETLLLDSGDGPIDSASRMGRCDCCAMVLLLGPILQPIAESLLGYVAADQSPPPSPRSRDAGGIGKLRFAASPLADGGAICRIAGPSAQAVGAWIHGRLAPLSKLMGETPWERKR